MWSSLPSNLRAVLGVALLLGVGVAVAAFALSFFALRAAAENPALRWGQHAWLFPVGIDMGLIFFEVLLLAASMVRVQERGRVVQYPRTVPFLLVLVAGAATLYFNATRVPELVRPIALAVPVASILVTLGLAYLLKMLAAAAGVEPIHVAPMTLQPGHDTAVPGTLHGQILRLPNDAPSVHGQSAGGGQTPMWGRSEASEATGQFGQPWPGGGAGTTKRQQIDSYLDYLGPDAALALGARKVTNALRNSGVDVAERYVKQAMDARAGAPDSNGKHK